MFSVGVVILDDVEELDFVGPWEVFTSAAKLAGEGTVALIAEHDGPVRCAKGMRVLPDRTFSGGGAFDVIVVPGGMGTRKEVENGVLLDWLRSVGPGCTWITSVCSGSLLLHEAGLARGRRVTTHHSFIPTLRQRAADLTVLEGVRFVRDGNVVTSAGVSAGIDMALWIVGQLHGADFARRVQSGIEYYPSPPYTAEIRSSRGLRRGG